MSLLHLESNKKDSHADEVYNLMELYLQNCLIPSIEIDNNMLDYLNNIGPNRATNGFLVSNL